MSYFEENQVGQGARNRLLHDAIQRFLDDRDDDRLAAANRPAPAPKPEPTPAPVEFGFESLGQFLSGGVPRPSTASPVRPMPLTPSAVKAGKIYRDHETYSTFSGML